MVEQKMSTRSYLEKKVYPYLQSALLDVLLIPIQLFNHLDESGELERYWKILAQSDIRVKEELKRIGVEQKRLELGPDYRVNDSNNEDSKKLHSGSSSEEESESEDDNNILGLDQEERVILRI